MKKQIYTAVVVGCGRIGASFEFEPGRPKPASHAAAFQHNKRTQLLAVVDADEKLAKVAAAYYRVPYYTSAEECFKELTPDLVAIATPPSAHEAVVKLALKYGVRGIVCEKPLADSEKSGKAILSAIKNSSTVLVVNHQRRFFPLFKKLKQDIASGKFGRVQQVTCYYNNGLYNNGTHTIDALRFLLGSECSWVMGSRNESNTTAPHEDSNVDGLLGFKSGTVAALQSLDVKSIGIHDFHLLCDKGEVSITKYGYRFERRPIKKSAEFKGVQEIASTGSVAQEVRSMLAGTTQHLVDCIEGKTSDSDAAEGLETMRVLDALMKSAHTSKLIKL
jgi:predicted dehydrogenase